MEKNNLKNQKGVSIYLALLLIAIFLDLSFGLSFLLFGEILTTRDIGNSVVAFYAADTGIERIFYMDNYICYNPGCPADCVSCSGGLKSGYILEDQPLGEAFYDASFATTDIGSGIIMRIATSTGYYQKTLRSIRGEY